jgi:hypothetical protein
MEGPMSTDECPKWNFTSLHPDFPAMGVRLDFANASPTLSRKSSIGVTSMAQEERESHKFTIFVNNKEFRTDKHELTGAQVKELAGVPLDYELFEVRGDQTLPVGNDQQVRIHDRMHFRAIPAGTFGK